jgi:hypothetical protein
MTLTKNNLRQLILEVIAVAAAKPTAEPQQGAQE